MLLRIVLFYLFPTLWSELLASLNPPGLRLTRYVTKPLMFRLYFFRNYYVQICAIERNPQSVLCRRIKKYWCKVSLNLLKITGIHPHRRAHVPGSFTQNLTDRSGLVDCPTGKYARWLLRCTIFARIADVNRRRPVIHVTSALTKNVYSIELCW